ncbi:hypothetical protein WDJ51_02180 [Rathayibacter sp. YIM 133350]|uniref:hypothetical protein n=1 Tax=Rathayibacter sp. YIM 133350 TaxID=3131992 RepID=UPI00307F977E
MGLILHARQRRLRRIHAVALCIAAVASLLSFAQLAPESAQALDGSQFDAGNIISDENFFNSSTMNADDVQSFLNARVVTCAASSGQPCLKDYRQATYSQGADAYCQAYSGAGSETAASIIAKVGAACGINPQVLIVMLQKEQGLITSPSPTSTMYRSAMGYGCPDTAACDTEYYGFYNQVYNAAHQFQRYTKTSASWSYQPGRWNAIQWHPNAACGTSQVWIVNQATANLYIYTPYQPNAAALGNLYGTGDGCSSYGNRNFWRYYNDWFGNPSNWVRSASFEGGSVAGWTASNGFINTQVYRDSSISQDGEWFFATNTPAAGRALTQDARRNVSIGESATVTMWVRSADSTPYKGTLAVWGLGGTQEGSRTDFTATTKWQQVTTELPVYASSHDVIRLDLYLQQTLGTLWVDNVSMSFGKAPAKRNLLSNPSFEGSFAGWGPGNGAINQQVWQDKNAYDGAWLAAANTSQAGRSFAQEFPVSPRSGDVYNFSIALRSETPSAPMKGRVAIWALGRSAPMNSVADFTAGGTWSTVSVSIDIGSLAPSAIKVEIYMDSVGSTLWLDAGTLARNVLTAGSMEGGAFPWSATAAGVNVAVYSTQTSGIVPPAGTWFGATNASKAGASIYQDVSIRPRGGDTYQAELWVRSGAGPFTGRLAVWGLGGTTEVASSSFVADGTWKKITMPVQVTTSDHGTMRFEVYLDTPSSTLFFDGANLY